MFLIIDNTEENKLTFSFWLNKKFIQRSYAVAKKDAGILVYLDKLLISHKLKLKDINSLGVVVGHGKFTSSRLVVILANTLAYSLKIPVVALPKNFDQTLAIKLVESAKTGKYVIPIYSAEARIG